MTGYVTDHLCGHKSSKQVTLIKAVRVLTCYARNADLPIYLNIIITRMAISRAHTSAMAADLAMLLLNVREGLWLRSGGGRTILRHTGL